MNEVIWCLMATKLACNGNVGGSVVKGRILLRDPLRRSHGRGREAR